MTDEELKALVAGLAKSQDRTDEQMKHTDEQMRRTDEQMKLIGEKIASLYEEMKLTSEQMNRTDEQMKHTDEQMKRTDEQMKHTDEQMKRTDEQMKRTDEKLERIGIMVGNISHNQGDIAEEFFFQSLLKDNHLGDIHFDDIIKGMYKHSKNIQEEYDLVMTNGDTIGIVEVKYKAHENDLAKLERKMINFKKLFPVFNSYKVYGALASFHVNDKIKITALDQGFFILQRSGDIIQTDCGERLMIL